MRIQTVLLALILFTPFVYGQKLKDIEAIKLNTKFILELTEDESSNLTYEIVSTESFEDELQMNLAYKLLDEDLDKNRIQGILATGTFGSRRSVLLAMKSGFDKSLQYELMIDIKGRGRYKKTSTNPLNSGIPSTEIWPHNIHSIKIASLQELEFEPMMIPEPEIDSTCLLNPELTTERGELLFKQHFQKVTEGLTEEANFALGIMLSFEDSIKSEDVSLGHFYSLGEGIYPFFENYEFGNPLQYRRVECPYFDGHSSYFYTKDEKQVKVAGYQWGEFKLSDWPIEQIDRTELRTAFKQKYESIKSIVTEILGEPLPLNEEPSSGRIDTKWKSNGGVNVYLFMFDNYNEIRLYVYRD